MTSVLIVDDDAVFRSSTARDLAEQGFAVSIADSADQALQILSDSAIDVVLSDLRMPGTNGIDLLVKARVVAPRARGILMSGYASARDYQRAVECGAVRLLSKPFTASELLQAIRQAVECETGFRGSIHGLSLVDLLQMFHYARRSLAIVVDGLAPGHVFLDSGDIIHAVYRDQLGEPALRSILAMPAGSLRTMVLPQPTPRTIARDFQALLLDSLRTVDEDAPAGDAEALDDPEAVQPRERRSCEDQDDEREREALAPASHVERLIERLRRLDGYSSIMMIDADTGVVLGSDRAMAGLDTEAAAVGYSELYRLERHLLDSLGLGDRIEDVVITLSSQYHVLHAVTGEPSLLLCVVLDRQRASLGLARYAISVADDLVRGGS